eukprot:SAG31_NODE_27343_length_427_cov_1.103659_1_plen_78_part_10
MHLLRTAKDGTVYVGELSPAKHNKQAAAYRNIATWTFTAKMDHLACFLPATLVMGHLHGADVTGDAATDGNHLKLAEK